MSHKVSDLLKTSLAQGSCRGCVQGSLLSCWCLFVVLPCVLKWINRVRCHCTWRALRHFFGKSCVCLYLLDHRLCKKFPFSVWRKGHWLVTVRCPFMQMSLVDRSHCGSTTRNLYVHQDLFSSLQSDSRITYSMWSMHWWFLLCMDYLR